MPLPWRPEHGSVVRMYCTITYPNGEIFACDTRSILKKLSEMLKKRAIGFFGAEQEFYLFI